jgi:hypothetical protein
MGKTAKKSATRAQVDQSATTSSDSTEPSPDGKVAEALTSTSRPALTSSSAHDAAERMRVLQLLIHSAGRVLREVWSWLTHEQTHMRVLGWITWLFFLLMLGVMVFVVALRWDPLEMIAVVAAGTGLTAGGDFLRRFLRKPE